MTWSDISVRKSAPIDAVGQASPVAAHMSMRVTSGAGAGVDVESFLSDIDPRHPEAPVHHPLGWFSEAGTARHLSPAAGAATSRLSRACPEFREMWTR